MEIKINGFGEVSKEVKYNVYDVQLPYVFNKIKSAILEHIPSVMIEHVGSSSVPGIGGRNVVDMAIPVEEERHNEINSRLKRLGFQNSPFEHYLPLLVGSVIWQGNNYDILLYVIEPNNKIYKDWISFRDYMRNHPDDAKKYDELKHAIVIGGNNKNDAYQDAKAPFLQKMNDRIKESTILK